MNAQEPRLVSPQVAALAITYRHNELLLIQRSKEPQKYGWGFPGGSVNPGETLHDAACRELREETQVHGVPEKTFQVIEVNEFDSCGQHYHFILVAVLCRYTSGVAVASDDAMDCKWVSIEDILSKPSDFIDHVSEITQEAIQLLVETWRHEDGERIK